MVDHFYYFSACSGHPWSSGATPFLTKFILGVVPSKPGFTAVDITPFVSARHPVLSGAVPVNAGAGKLQLDALWTATAATAVSSGASVKIVVDSPVPARVALQKVRPTTDGGDCTLNPTIEIDSTKATATWDTKAGTTLVYGFTPTLSAGKHVVVFAYAGCLNNNRTAPAPAPVPAAAAVAAAAVPSVWPFPNPPVYPVASVLLDNVTRGGKWMGKYGKEAYVLFGYQKKNGKPSNLLHIKNGSFVHGFSFAKGCSSVPVPTTMVGVAPAAAFLANPAGKASAPNLGYASGGSDGSQGTYLDINTTAGIRYEVQIYMVASTASSKQVTRIMDLESLNPIAPGQLIENYSEGQWLVFEHDRPVRVQLMSIDGLSIVSAAMVSSTKA